MMPGERFAYAVKDWSIHYEKGHRPEREVIFWWIAISTRHDGKGYRRLLRQRKKIEIFCAFILILEVAAKMPTRGLLADEDGPLTSQDLADSTGFPAGIFELAFDVLTKTAHGITWLERVPLSGQVPTTPVQVPLEDKEDKEDKEDNSSRAGARPSTDLPDSPASRTRPKKAPSGHHAELIEHFARNWRSHFHEEYAFQGGKDGAAIGRILKACKDDLEKAKRIVSDYLSDSDPFIAKSGHTISILSSQMNRYLAAVSRTDMNGKPPVNRRYCT